MKKGAVHAVVSTGFDQPVEGRRRRHVVALSTRNLVVVAIVLVLLLFGGWWLFVRNSAEQPVDTGKLITQQQSAAQLESMTETAKEYPAGSNEWGNQMGLAAYYASLHGKCDKAKFLIRQLETSTVPDKELISSYKNQVEEKCAE